ncbi:FAD binding domain-containing protein [Varunaivibrio sulfuroxidans]|uniref:Carbon-monoxide dehydrogenase medium subunit/xanthine dehydrogenase FAD-binding subunit n=1 Tax=Varunaivibrio sulfuroxidans TaxID=1773489 RepID=A0A4R3JD61_9PROT|nr:FAD binding domain-containing protein [Varunaivibrio sulfuroxidans]TCS63093.1 carbon-monoxide dehydrogenase medium subunit/xanthine dehydrogenase FAD-binding subunit [Varunaivibrio sulfuroxidans]WES31835.1 FAD binding domain-containing protein [Varunaivibrio sulfuroxidans]
MLQCDTYVVPKTLGEAFDAMARHGAACRLLGGATDILPHARKERREDAHIPCVIDLSRVPQMRAVSLEAGRLVLGGGVPFQRFLDQEILVKNAAVMGACAAWFADAQIREQATIGGNIVNASPAADGVPPLLALNAEVVLHRRVGGNILERTVALADFVTGPGKTLIGADEILTTVRVDALPGYGAAFEKVGRRRSLVISTVCLAAAVELDPSGTVIADARLALGGVGPVAARLDECEAMLIGETVTAQLIEAVAQKPVERVASRTRRAYRRDVVRGFVMRALYGALENAGWAQDVPLRTETS